MALHEDHMRHSVSAVCELQTIQLYEMIIVRHGLMVVGLPFSGKSCSLNMLAAALSDLHAQAKQGALFEKVEMRVINPKSVTMGQLYGEVDKATQEWKVSVQPSWSEMGGQPQLLTHVVPGQCAADRHTC